MKKFHVPNAVELIKNARLERGTWGDGNSAVCMMSAMVPGAESFEDCVTGGWPYWLAQLNVLLFDTSTGAEYENKASYEFALAVAEAVQTPRDYDKALCLYSIGRLDCGENSALKSLLSLDYDVSEQVEAVQRVVSLLGRRLNGEDVSPDLEKAGEAAYAVRISARTSPRTAEGYATSAASWAATRSARRVTSHAAHAATRAVRETSDTEAHTIRRHAAWAASRTDLINALNAS